MAFLIYGRDSATFDERHHPLHEEHQSYMDSWIAQLVARGPTLSGDAASHTGSIHVLDVHDPQVAQSFASDEPYARAGWYADIEVSPFEILLPGTMWDRPAPADEQVSSYVQVVWAPQPRTPDLVESIGREVVPGHGPQWAFAGLLLSDDSAEVRGLAGSLDLPVPDAIRRMDEALTALPLAEPTLDVQRWRRGGRSA